MVYARNKTHTGFTPVDNAANLMDEVTRYVYKEKYVPKKYRLTLGLDLIRKADEIYDNVTYANRIYLKKENVKLRRSYWNKAYANCEQLDRKLQRLKNVVENVTPESMRTIFELLNNEKGSITERIERERLKG